MSADRCEPPAELRGVDGWHWVQSSFDKQPTPMQWFRNRDFPEGAWRWTTLGAVITVESCDRHGYRYIAPVPSPAAVAALVKAARLTVNGEDLVAVAIGVANLETALSAFPQPKDTDNAV